MKFQWINLPDSRTTGAFITARCYRQPDSSVRLDLYFSRRAVEKFGLKRGERLLIGLNEETQSLGFKLTMFGGHVLQHRVAQGALRCVVTLPFSSLIDAQFVKEEDISIFEETTILPFKFCSQGATVSTIPTALLKAA